MFIGPRSRKTEESRRYSNFWPPIEQMTPRTTSPLMHSKLIRFLDSSASGLLLAVAVALLIGDQTAADVILPHDPIFAISVRHLFWLGAGAALVTSLFVLFNGRATWPLLLLAWLATNFLVYQYGLYWQGGHGLTGYRAAFHGPLAFRQRRPMSSRCWSRDTCWRRVVAPCSGAGKATAASRIC